MWLRNISKYRKTVRIVLFIIFTGIILWITLFSRHVGQRIPITGLFWELRNGYWRDIVLNILLFVPLGVISGRWGTVAFGFVLSVSIELIQYIFCLGQCEVDDVLHNTLGTVIGVLIWIIVKKVEGGCERCIKSI